MGSGHRRWLLAIVVVAGCQSSGKESYGGGASTTGAPAAVTTVVPTQTPAAAPTGVPGVDGPDGFCSAWARFTATVQVLSVAGNFGSLTPVEFAELELTAVPTLRSAVAAMDRLYPDSIAAERATFLDDFAGPVGRRADRATEYLRITADDVTTLEEVWLDALRTRDPSAAVPDVHVPAALAEIVAAAAVDFAAEVTPFTMDPSLDRTGVATPQTDAYIAATCPDLSDLGVGDAI